MKRTLYTSLLLATIVFQHLPGKAQTDLINVFIDCNCDRLYLQQELNFVNHVRDLALADVRVFVSDIFNGGGGRTYNLAFTGQNEFEDISYENSFDTKPVMTPAEIREGLLKKTRQGLVPFLMQSEMADKIDIVIEGKPKATETPARKEDPWDRWIFEISGEGEFQTETSRSRVNTEFGFEGDRVSENWRIRLDGRFNYSESKFDSDEEEITVIRKRQFLSGSLVRSLGDHWSTGVFGGYDHSTFRNIQGSYYITPAIEYSLFPYREVLRKEITFSYRVGYNYRDYIETTIYGKDSESLFSQSLNAQVRFRQPWGDVFSILTARSFLHDFSKSSFSLYGRASIRIFKGLAVRMSTNMELIRNQLNLPAGNASIEDVLLRQRQIATDFEMRFSVGVSYTFGSAFNNIVNTRL